MGTGHAMEDHRESHGQSLSESDERLRMFDGWWTILFKRFWVWKFKGTKGFCRWWEIFFPIFLPLLTTSQESISIRWNKLIVEGANVWMNTFEQPVRDFDVLVCTKRLCHLFSWSLCEVEIHRTYTDSLATSMWLQMLEVEATTCSTNDHVFRAWGQLTHQFCWQVAPSANVEVSLPQKLCQHLGWINWENFHQP